MSDEERKFVPPYGVPWNAFYSAFDRMSDQKDGLPNRIDRSYLSKHSGNVQTYLMQAFRSFELTDQANVPTEALRTLVQTSEDSRPRAVGEMLDRYYTPIIELGTSNATQGELEESWTKVYGQTGDTRRKAIRFFLSACSFSQINLSKLWKAPRSASGASRAKATTRKPNGSSAEPAPPQSSRNSADDSYQVTLRGGGTVTVTVIESHFNLSKHRDDRKFVYDLVDAMTTYADQNGQDLLTKEEQAASERDGEA